MRFAAFLLALALPGTAPVTGHASGCSSKLVVFSWITVPSDQDVRVGGINPNEAVCTALPDENTIDSRLILPGASSIVVSYTADILPAKPPSLTVALTGLGYSSTTVTLVRHESTQGTSYDSTALPISSGPGAIYVKATSKVTDETCFHTADSGC